MGTHQPHVLTPDGNIRLDRLDGSYRQALTGWDPQGYMGAYYEIWQKDRENGRPLVVDGEHLRFSDDKSTPGRFNLHDATWD
ncbi:hypothetical protein [Streptomyces sp. NPDC051704]|uniref:hypothetical protein n=1 Tax=Streptomyces sp. NPDC051704 TaxID=3365671 RepID=UPI0037B1B0F2